jgi:hypothetical protein
MCHVLRSLRYVLLDGAADGCIMLVANLCGTDQHLAVDLRQCLVDSHEYSHRHVCATLTTTEPCVRHQLTSRHCVCSIVSAEHMLHGTVQRVLPILLRNFSKLFYRALVLEPDKRWPALYPLAYIASQPTRANPIIANTTVLNPTGVSRMQLCQSLN